MKTILLSFIILFSSVLCFGQTRYGIKGGLNLANQTYSVSQYGSTASQSGDMIPSFHIGVFADFPIAEHVVFMPELLLSGKGSNFVSYDGFSNNSITIGFRPYYFDIPLNIAFKKTVKKGNSFFIGGGPQFGIGLFGNYSTPDSTTEVFQAGVLKRFDMGINLLTGIELKSGWRFSINYTWGLTSIIDDGGQASDYDDEGFYNKVFGFSAAYILKRKK